MSKKGAEAQKPAPIEQVVEEIVEEPAEQTIEEIAEDIVEEQEVQEEVKVIDSIQLTSSLAIVIATYAGSEAVMHDIWAKYAPRDSELHIIPDAPLSELISEIIANPDIADEFVLVPANCVPLSQCDEADLKLKKLYITKDGESIYDSRLPILLTKEVCAKILSQDEDYDKAELFFERCAELTAVRASEVSFHFGNEVVPISRENFNTKALQEMMQRKRFVTIHTPQAWSVAEPFFKQLI